MTRHQRLSEIIDATAGNMPKAISLAKLAKSEGVVDPLVHHIIAIDLRQGGLYEAAIVEAGLGLALNPTDAGLTTTVGFCLLELGRRQEAAQVFSAAVGLDPSSSEANYGYGWAAERLGALEAAESAFKRAVALNPRHADALAGLSGLAARRRDWDTARGLADQAISLDPRQTDALTTLARVELGQERFEAAIQRLSAIIELPHLNQVARANLLLMRGDALDGLKRYEEAFCAYSEGKAALNEIYADVHALPGTPTAVDTVNRILAEFIDSSADAWSYSRPPSGLGQRKAHAFLLGFPRSGTTLLEQVLATHPDVATLEERPVMIDSEAQFLTENGGVRRLADVVGEMLEPYRDAYWTRVQQFGVDPKNKVFIDKHPLSTIRLPLISKMFPDAKIIFAIRDPRDVVLSCFRRSFNMNSSMYQFNSIVTAADYYHSVMQAGEKYLSVLPLQIHRLRYEELVTDFEHTVRALCDFLGLQWTERLKDFGANARSHTIATPSSTQVGRGLYDEGMNQWRRYEFALKPVLPVLKPWIERFGYPDS